MNEKLIKDTYELNEFLQKRISTIVDNSQEIKLINCIYTFKSLEALPTDTIFLQYMIIFTLKVADIYIHGH